MVDDLKSTLLHLPLLLTCLLAGCATPPATLSALQEETQSAAELEAVITTADLAGDSLEVGASRQVWLDRPSKSATVVTPASDH